MCDSTLHILARASALIRSSKREGMPTVLLTSSELRRHVRRLIAREHPRLAVLAFNELLADVQVESVGTIGLF